MTCRHKRAGRVTNQTGEYNPSLPHASEAVCARAECINAAVRRVAGLTNMTATYIPDRVLETEGQ